MAMKLSHIIRIFGTNKDGDVLTDIWADVERDDVMRTVEKENGHWQGGFKRFYWYDDQDSNDGAGGNPSRTFGVLKVCSPDEDDPENPTEWIPIRTNIRQDFREGRSQHARHGNRNSADNRTRRVKARRIIHRDTTIDDEVQRAIDADSTRRAYVVPADRYDFVEDSDDKDQYIEVEMPSSFLQKYATDTGGQNVYFGPKNKYLVNLSKDAEDPAGPHGFDPPWALDPHQRIVNIQFDKQLPQYAAISGWAGITNVMFFYVDEDDDSLVRVDSTNPLGYSGWSSYVSSGEGNVPSSETSLAVNNGSDWKGNFRIEGGLKLIAVPVWDGPGPPPEVPLPTPKYMNYKGEVVSGFEKRPEKGIAKGGLWVQRTAVSKYNGDTLLWRREFDNVYEVLSGGRILADIFDSPGYGVFTLSPEDGSTASFVMIGDGGLGVNPSMGWDTASDGSTYAGFLTTSFVEEQTFSTVLKKFDITGKVVWEKNLPDIVGNGIVESLLRIPITVQNKKGKTFVIVPDAGPRSIVVWSDDHQYTYRYNSLLNIYDEDGKLLETITWGTNTPFYGDDSAEDDLFLLHAADDNYLFINAPSSTFKFPDAP